MICYPGTAAVVADSKGLEAKKRLPPIRSTEVTDQLCRALKDCLIINASLKCLELQGVPLREGDAKSLAKVSTWGYPEVGP